MVQTQTATATISPRADAAPKREGVPDLYYYPDTARLRTPFRDTAIDFIYRTALEADDGRLKYGCVSLYTPRIEDDVETLDLTLVIDAGWDVIADLEREIRSGLEKWGKEWTDKQRKDFIRRIDFMYLPATYASS